MEKESFEKFIKSNIDLSDHDLEEILQSYNLQNFRKGASYISTNHSIYKTLSFLSHGVARTYIISDRDEEITKRIAIGPTMITSLKSFITQSPTEEKIEFLEDSVVFTIGFEDDKLLLEKSKAYCDFRRIGMEHSFLNLLDYFELFISKNAEKRFKHVIETNPEIFNRVKLKYIASLLGVTKWSLSRMRKKYQKENLLSNGNTQ